MNGRGKSDRPIVPRKPPNEGGELDQAAHGGPYTGTKAETPDTAKGRPNGARVGKQPEEEVEERGLAKGNSLPQNTPQTQCWLLGVQSERERVRKAAARDSRLQFTSLMHHICNIATLREAYFNLKKDAAAGVDGVTWREYGKDLENNLPDLSARLKRGAYRAKPVRRSYISKQDGRQRPLGITALEDKVVQRAAVEVLNAIYEVDFLGFSYGFRPGRNTHKALDAVTVGIERKKVNWVLDADIRGFFDAIDREDLMRFVEHRIRDRRVLRLIRKWLNAGVLEDGKRHDEETGTPQGGVISPLLANIYLHYVLDLWAHQWRRRHARGDVIIIRYADDFVVGFQERADAERFREELAERLGKFNLELHPDKTRLIEFGRFAAVNRKGRGEGKPETFDFLGFTHICGKTKRDWFRVLRLTARKKMTAKLKELKEQLRRRRHHTVAETGQWLHTVLVGHIRYYGVPGNYRPQSFRHAVVLLWKQALERRSQKGRLSWERMNRYVARWLPRARTTHPYPDQRLCVIT
jgi:group II intron reverse transcriptase/maturase